MNYLNAQQLAFILDIKKEDARAMMCNAWEKGNGIAKDRDTMGFESVHGAKWDRSKVKDSYPHAMPIDLLATHLNIPGLQSMVDDIINNYLVRKATRKYILCDYPEKKIKSAENEGKEFPIKIDLNPALKSMLPTESIQQIYNWWRTEFKDAQMKPRLLVKQP